MAPPKKVVLLLLLLGATAFHASAQPRTKTSLNDGWKFLEADADGAQQTAFNDSAWQNVNIPHTWNIDDPWDDEPGYDRGPAWYRRELKVDRSLAGKRLFLYFEGANQVADVYVNGEKAGSHIGGYSAFAFDITSLVKPGERTVLAVRVDNSFNEDIPPLTADFTFYGGIYRDIWLIAANDVHFDVTDHASPGVRITTPQIAAGDGTITIDGSLVNSGNQARNVEIVSTVFDGKRKVAEAVSRLQIDAGKESRFEHSTSAVKQLKLWSPDSPNLYSVRNVIRENGKVIDEVVQPLGFRWFSFDSEKGFFLNGKHLKLRGANRHQDFAELGNALPDRLHVQDMQIIKDAGFNFVRLAHYPQDTSVLEACDRLGLLVWEETPLVNYITKSGAFTENAKVMVREMVRQHRNHPSVLMWGYMNEIFLRFPKGRDDLYPVTVELARELNRIAKTEDPTRPTAIAFHGNDIYNTTGLGEVPDIIGWNLYQGWYSAALEDFGKFIDDQHRRYPKRPLIISEYGANADRRLHSTEPRRFDSTIEYQRQFHESYLAQIAARPFIAGSAVWNQFDFGVELRGETIPHLNQKGLYYYDRKPKDVYFFYKAALSKEKVLHIAVRDQAVFAGPPGKEHPIDVYSNFAEVDLILDGKSLGRRQTNGFKARWILSFKDGVNVLEARGSGNGRVANDRVNVTNRNITASSPEIALNVGSNADYIDESGRLWMADQPYKTGSWGFVGPGTTRIYGSPPDKNILSTDDDPLYQTMCEGLDSYKIDVPAGNYSVELLFAETKTEQAGKRVFDVSVNSKPAMVGLDLAASPGAFRPLVKTVEVITTGGIEIKFSAKVGKPVLNGIRVMRRS